MTVEAKILELVKQVNPDNPLSYVQNIVKPMSKEKLDEAIASCEDCEIACNSKKSVTMGNPNASILVIGESVSEEQQNGDSDYVYPFCDSAGDYLFDMFNHLGVNQNQVFYINSVNCFPSRNGIKRKSTVAERKNCKYFLDYALKTVEPLLIICLGAVAVNGINEEIGKQKISDIRGTYFTYRGIHVMPTYHPAYFKELQGTMPDEMIEELYNDFCSDLSLAVTDLQELYPQLEIINQ
jgi:DNA polymerase